MFQISTLSLGFSLWRKPVFRTHKRVFIDNPANFHFGKVIMNDSGLYLKVRNLNLLGHVYCFLRKTLGLGCMRIRINDRTVTLGKIVPLDRKENRLVFRLIKPNGKIVEKGRNIIRINA